MADSGKKQVPLRLSAKLYDAIAAWAEDDFRFVIVLLACLNPDFKTKSLIMQEQTTF